jgi:hypothetical protein
VIEISVKGLPIILTRLLLASILGLPDVGPWINIDQYNKKIVFDP